jgi:hypothetical protein
MWDLNYVPTWEAFHFLVFVFPGSDKKCLRYCVNALWITIIRAAPIAVGYLSQSEFFIKLCKLLHSVRNIPCIQGCLQLITATANSHELSADDTRRAFPIDVILSCMRFNDVWINLGISEILATFFASGALTLKDFDGPINPNIIPRFLRYGTESVKCAIMRLIHTIVQMVPREDLKGVFTKDFLEEYFDVFIASDSVTDSVLIASLPILINLAAEFVDFNFDVLVTYLNDVVGDEHTMDFCQHLLNDIERSRHNQRTIESESKEDREESDGLFLAILN